MESKRSTQTRPATATMSGGQERAFAAGAAGGLGGGSAPEERGSPRSLTDAAGAPPSAALATGSGGGAEVAGGEDARWRQASSGVKSRPSAVPPNQQRSPARVHAGSPTRQASLSTPGTGRKVPGVGPG